MSRSGELSVEQVVARAQQVVAIEKGDRRHTVLKVYSQHPNIRLIVGHMFVDRQVSIRLRDGQKHVGKVVAVGTLWQGSYAPAVVLNPGSSQWDRIISTALIDSIQEVS